jgi:iron complex outermembrane recepter protein
MKRSTQFTRLLPWGCAAICFAAGGAGAQTAGQVDLPAQPLAKSLQDVARQTGANVLFSPGAVAGVPAPAISGAVSPAAAVSRLIDGTHLEMVQDGTQALIIRPKSDAPIVQTAQATAPASAGPAAAAAPATPEKAETITVTARLIKEDVTQVPISITTFSAQTLEDYNIKSFTDYATKSPDVSFSYGGGPTGIADARTVAIRGISGQNLYGTAGATGFYIDDTPVPGSIDPRVLDIDNIEVLKGPQGTLFGESSLGGNVRLITKKPDLNTDSGSITTDFGFTAHGGSPDGGIGAIGNIVVIPDELALRAVLFQNHDAGYLTRTYPTDPNSPGTYNPSLSVPRSSVGDQGADDTYGGSLTALLKLGGRVDAKLRYLFQDTSDNGFPAAYAPLPGFEPNYTLDRAFDVQSEAYDKWALPSFDLTYHGDGWTVVNSESYFHRHTRDVEDSTYGTQQANASFFGVTTGPGGLPAQPFLWVGDHTLDSYTTETRLSVEPIYNLSGTIGFYYSNSQARFSIPPIYASGLSALTGWPNNELWEQNNPETETDLSVYGELYYKFLDRFNLTLGGRQYWLHQRTDFTANGFQNGGLTPSSPLDNSQVGFDPKAALSYQVTDQSSIYVSASKGFRAGGSQPYPPFCQSANLPASDVNLIKSDKLWTYEGGAKFQLADPNILVTAAGFHIDWSDIQQQVALPCGSYLELNGKSASVNGGEVEAEGRVIQGLKVRVGLGYEATSVDDPGNLALAGLPAGSRILGTPAFTATVGSVYTRELSDDIDGFVSADYSYTGDSDSLLNGTFGTVPPTQRSHYQLVNARIGVDWGSSELSLNIHNLTNTKPNLGDLGYVGYAQFNAAGSVVPQVATYQPLTATVQYKVSF